MDPQDVGNPRKQSFFVRLLWQMAAALLITLLTELIHFRVHPLNSVTTAGGAFLVALSYLPGMIIGYSAVRIQQLTGEEEPDVPVAAVICALLWFVFLFRALTLLLGLPGLSDWTDGPANAIVQGLEWLDPEKLGHWLFG